MRDCPCRRILARTIFVQWFALLKYLFTVVALQKEKEAAPMIFNYDTSAPAPVSAADQAAAADAAPDATNDAVPESVSPSAAPAVKAIQYVCQVRHCAQPLGVQEPRDNGRFRVLLLALKGSHQ